MCAMSSSMQHISYLELANVSRMTSLNESSAEPTEENGSRAQQRSVSFVLCPYSLHLTMLSIADCSVQSWAVGP